MSGQGFELTAFGAVPLGTKYLDPAKTSLEEAAQYVVRPDYGNDDSAPVAASQAPVSSTPRAPAVAAQQRAAAPAPVASPGNVIASAKARVKELRAELRRMKSLQKELAELERLLKAAKQKPTASVRPLRSVG